jgi:hypothetical protein
MQIAKRFFARRSSYRQQSFITASYKGFHSDNLRRTVNFHFIDDAVDGGWQRVIMAPEEALDLARLLTRFARAAINRVPAGSEDSE